MTTKSPTLTPKEELIAADLGWILIAAQSRILGARTKLGTDDIALIYHVQPGNQEATFRARKATDAELVYALCSDEVPEAVAIVAWLITRTPDTVPLIVVTDDGRVFLLRIPPAPVAAPAPIPAEPVINTRQIGGVN